LNPKSFSDLRPPEHGTQMLRLLPSGPDLFPSKTIPEDKPSAKLSGPMRQYYPFFGLQLRVKSIHGNNAGLARQLSYLQM